MSVRHDWYQSETHVVITVLLKNAAEKHYAVDISSNQVHMTADNYEFKIELNRPINVERSTHKVYSTKVEIILAKIDGERWDSLEKKAVVPAASCGPPTLHKKDWDGLAKEVEKTEEAEAQNEEALARLFSRIYSSSSPEVRKAMNKSYTESGGTVLSTNWNDVSKGKVDVKPPDGTEHKKFD